MPNFSRTVAALALCLAECLSLSAQAVPKPAARPIPWKAYCHPAHGFCFKYPAAWTMLGEVFDGNGVVVAPPQKQARELWDEVTVVLVVPAPTGDEEPVTIGETIAQAVAGVRQSGQSFETQERRQQTVDGQPAESVKLHYAEPANGHEWIEEMVFIEGPDREIYSLALKTAPASLPRMEPLFQRMVESWKLPEAAPPPGATGEAPAGAKPNPGAAAPSKSPPPKFTVPPKP